jgi:hypothetical protein
MDDYLAKPFERDDLELVLANWCGGGLERQPDGALDTDGESDAARAAS